MGKLARFLFRADDLLQRALLGICGFILLMMVVISALGVVFRFVLHSSLSWSEEIVAYLFVWLTCLGAAVGFKLRAHPEVKALVERMPRALQVNLSVLTDLVVMALGYVMVRHGGEMIALMGTETAASLPISMAYPYLAIPLGGAALMFHSACHALSLLLAGKGQAAIVSVPGHGSENV